MARNIQALRGPKTAEAIDVLERVEREESGKQLRHQTTDLAISRATVARDVI